MGKKQLRQVLLVAVAVVGLFVSLSPDLAAAGSYGNSGYKGERLYSRALLRVENVDGQVLLYLGIPQPGLLAKTFTLSDCGRELAPNLTNLQAMVGKPVAGWSLTTEKGLMVYHRLEFQCN